MSDLFNGPFGAILIILLGLGTLLYYISPKTYDFLRLCFQLYAKNLEKKKEELQEKKKEDPNP